MTGGQTIIDIQSRDADEVQEATTAEVLADAPAFAAPAAPESDAAAAYVAAPDEVMLPAPAEAPSPWQSAAPIALVAASVIWMGVLTWLALDAFAGMSGLALAQFGAALVAGPALAGIVWLILLRTSRTEAQRFTATAHAMREEAAALEWLVASLTGTLEQNRAQLAEQARQIGAIGNEANARLAAIGRGLSEEIDQADVHARSLAEAAGHAQTSLATLLDAMPKAQGEAEALVGRINDAASAAAQQTDALDAQIAVLTERARGGGGRGNRGADAGRACRAHGGQQCRRGREAGSRDG